MNDFRPFAFVLMPFDHEFRDLYKFGIRKSAEDNGIVAERVDEQNFSETILERIYRQIENSDFIIAEMTGKNPNVFYEVGYAHAKGKMCTLITQDASDIPFDLKHHTHVIYDGTIEILILKLSPKLKWMKEEAERSKSTAIDVDLSASYGVLNETPYSQSGSVDFEISLKNNTDRRSPEIEAIYLSTSEVWEASVNNSDCVSDINPQTKTKRHLISPSIRRLAPGAFSKEKVTLTRKFWSKYSGDEKKKNYHVSGKISVEISTSEGIIKSDIPLKIVFDEIPF